MTAGDNVKAIFGDGNDLQIYHNGTNSIVADTGTGNLSPQSSGSEVLMWDTTNNQHMAQFKVGGEVNLRHNGSTKLQTTSTGISVTGDVTVSGNVDGRDISGITATNAEPNVLDGITATTAELNYTDGVTSNIQTQLDAIAGAPTITVTVSGGKFLLDGTSQQTALLGKSLVYRFDQSDSSNASHPLKFSTTSDGTHNSGTALSTGVTTVGTAGSAGAYVEITTEQDQADTIYYYCANHSGMGGIQW